MYRRVAIALSLLGGLACAGTPAVSPLGAGPIGVPANQRVVVDQAYLIVDSSASVAPDFATEKALVQSFVGAMPTGTYQTGSVAFGGYQRQIAPLGSDRAQLEQSASDLQHLSEGTPLDRVLGEVGKDLSGKRGRAAVVIFSDGKPTDPVGRELDHQKVLDAAENLAKSYNGELCIHTVQVGDDAGGAAFLKKLASTTACGSSRSASSVENVAALQDFERNVFLGSAPAAVAAAPGDADRDGVIDAKDQCPNTPLGAPVDKRGCWTVPGLTFAFDSDKIEPQYYGKLDEVVRVLEHNPKMTIDIDGHTDSIGTAAYNQKLSERRAKSVKSYLVGKGIAASRLIPRGFGASKPAYPNDTKENRRANRRTEFNLAD